MENFEETPAPLSEAHATETLKVTEDVRSYMYETAKWTKFLSIIGFIGTGFMVLISFSVGAIMSVMDNMLGDANPYAKLGTGALTVILLLSALLYFYPSLLLFKYSNAAKKAVLYEDQASLGIAVSKLKSFFKFWGILIIVVLAFYIIIFLFAIVAGIGAATMSA
jgi:hypothetical protein